MISKPVRELILGDAQRRVRVDRCCSAMKVYRPCSRKYLPIAFISSERAVERRHRRPRVARPDEVDDPEQPEVAVRADRRMLRREALVVLRA